MSIGRVLFIEKQLPPLLLLLRLAGPICDDPGLQFLQVCLCFFGSDQCSPPRPKWCLHLRACFFKDPRPLVPLIHATFRLNGSQALLQIDLPVVECPPDVAWQPLSAGRQHVRWVTQG